MRAVPLLVGEVAAGDIFGVEFVIFVRKPYLCLPVVGRCRRVKHKTKVMHIFKKSICLAGIALFAWTGLHAQQQVRQTREEYIERYKAIAIDHMEHYDIPASITMAQGILESDCGNSSLARRSNNHFGIKCKSNWTGARVYHDDDAKGECFRSYESVEESFRDHAEFLDTSPRYDSLFAYPATDYKRWARGLKAAGYATAPDYAQRLIRIIEESELFLLDQPDGSQLYAARSAKPASEPVSVQQPQPAVPAAAEEVVDPDNYQVTVNAFEGYNVYTVNGVYYIRAKEGDTFESVGKRFRISAANLRKFNDRAKRAQPVAGQPIFIECKPKSWSGDAAVHVCRAGETLYTVSQRYGVRLKQIEKLNKAYVGASLPEGFEVRLK